MSLRANTLNIHGGALSLSDTSIFANQAEILSNGLVLLRTVSDLLGDLPSHDAVNVADLSLTIRLAEELIQIGVQKN